MTDQSSTLPVIQSEGDTGQGQGPNTEQTLSARLNDEALITSFYQAQIWVTALSTWGALMYTVYAFSMVTNELKVESGFEVMVGVAAEVWISPILGLVLTFILSSKVSKRRGGVAVPLGTPFKVLFVVQQILFMVTLLGILWVLFLPKIPQDPGSRVIQYIFLFCPYILCINSLFQCELARLGNLLCCCCTKLDIEAHDLLEDTQSINQPT